MSKTYSIFYSWQSDTKDKSRSIIENALSIAKQELQENEGISIEIDHSTLGKSGMPSIDQTILRKIDNCDIFLCDLTPVVEYQKTESNGKNITKLVPNPNVLLELGYAMSAVGVDYIIPVAHKGKWLPSEMPFDINHHSLYCFTKDECNLTNSILAVINYIKKNGPHRHLDKPFWRHELSLLFMKVKEKVSSKPYDPYKDAIIEHSTEFFKRRMCAAFPGKRGLIEYTDRKQIRKALSKLLKVPLKFKKAIGYDSLTDPIWWFRGGSAMNIDKYRYLGTGRFLLSWDELKIRRLIAYIDSGRYYSNYVYIEFDGDRPTNLNYDYYTSAKINELHKSIPQVTEEYAIFKPCCFLKKKITAQEADDGYTRILGKTIELKNRYEFRIRSLTPFNYIIAAKQSAFNNPDFDRSSGAILDGMLDGTVSKEQMNEYMMKFPKPYM